MRSRLDEVYRCETGFIALDKNDRNPMFGIDGYVGTLAMRRVLVSRYPKHALDRMLKLMTFSEKRTERVFCEGNRVVVSDGRVLKSDPSTPALRTALDSEGFVANEIRILDRRYQTDLGGRLNCDLRRHTAVVAPNLIDRMGINVQSGYGYKINLELNGQSAYIDSLGIITIGIAQKIKEFYTHLPKDLRRPFKAEEIVLQHLYDLINYKKPQESAEVHDERDDFVPENFRRFLVAIFQRA